MSRTDRAESRGGRASWFALSLAAILGLAATPGTAQESTSIPSPPACQDCRIQVDTLVVLGDREGPGILFEQSTVRMGGDGKFYVASTYLPGVSKVFDRDGEFVTTFGRRGEGPGEYQLPTHVHDEGDRLVIFDELRPRVTTLDRELRVLETHRLPMHPQSVAPVGEGRYVISAVSWTPELVGFPLHLYDVDGGELVRSFGDPGERVVTRSDTPLLLRIVASGRDGTVWSAPVSEYMIEHWDQRGELLRAYERDASWFPPPGERSVQPARIEPPTPRLRGIAQDGDGYLWVLILTAAEDWEPLPPAAEVDGMTFTSDAQMDRLHETIVEVLDLRGDSPVVVTSRRFSGRMLGFVAPGVVATYAEDEIGAPRYVLQELSLEGW